jgi:hypothetical protein
MEEINIPYIPQSGSPEISIKPGGEIKTNRQSL